MHLREICVDRTAGSNDRLQSVDVAIQEFEFDRPNLEQLYDIVSV